jgi:LPXTG-site transpeptidase (sortase) family protein
MTSRLKRSFVSWLLFAGGALFLMRGGSSITPLLFPREYETPIVATSKANSIAEFSPGTPLFMLSIPRLSARMVVVEGTTDAALRKGPGRLEGTAWPGSAGNVVLAGHRDTHFRVLKDIRPQDEIQITAGGETRTYFVTKTYIVKPEDLSPLEATSPSELTLITCYPFYYLGPAPDRFIVKAAESAQAISQSGLSRMSSK